MIAVVNEFLDDMRGGKMTEAPVVSVTQGRLQGRVATTPNEKEYFSFQGIPYAKPPLGSLRFKAPQPHDSWDDIRDATAEGNVTAQFDPLIHKEFIGDENCLFLNVYTPNLDGAFLPVMVFIHGGGFKYGSGNTSLYGPEYLVERDVIVVTLNYRCGPLGFLCLNTPEIPGNAGLKDIALALKWVKENIHNFGGSAENITVFGNSAGAVSVGILTASPVTKDLINKAIIQSGPALASWAFQKNPIENAKHLAKELGCNSDDLDEIFEFLSTTPARDLVDAHKKMHPPQMFFEKATIIFAPVVEKEFPGVEAIITEPFIDLLTSGRIADVPLMIGSTALEFTFERTNDDLRIFIPDVFNIDKNTEEAVTVAEQIKRTYFPSGTIGVGNLNEYFQLLSDRLINIDTHRYIKYLTTVSNKPIYLYKFDYVGELNVSKKLLESLGLTHAAHNDELGYLFKNILQNEVTPTPSDIKMRERMLRLWTNFAKGGNPTPDENEYLTVTWLPVKKDNLYYLNLGSELSLGTDPDKDKMLFWEDLYSKYYKMWEQPNINSFSTKTVEREETDFTSVEKVQITTTESIEISETVQVVNKVEESVRIVKEDVKEDVVDVVEEVEAVLIEPEPAEPEPLIEPEPIIEPEPVKVEPRIVETVKVATPVVSVTEKPVNGNVATNGIAPITPMSRASNEVKMVSHTNGGTKDVIRANDPPEDDLPKNIGVNKFVNFFESLGGKK